MNHLRELREEKGLLQKELAQKVGFSQKNISDWETLRTEPNITALIKLADYFETSIDYLIGRENEINQIVIQNELDVKERELISYYRVLSPFEQGELVGAARAMAKRSAV